MDTFTIVLAVILVLANVILSSFLFLMAYLFISKEAPAWPVRIGIFGKNTTQVLARISRQKMAMSPAQRRQKANAYILRGATWLVMVALVLWLVFFNN
jgi:hypothetical protein